MSDRISKFIDQTIWFSYLALAIVTPLIFSTKNSELFEVPKMIFVYLGATLILFLTGAKFILQGRIVYPASYALRKYNTNCHPEFISGSGFRNKSSTVRSSTLRSSTLRLRPEGLGLEELRPNRFGMTQTANIVLIILSIFLLVNILSTFFSLDKFTSIFGYPSRLNGGLISTFSYLVIFAGVLVNLTLEKGRKLLIAAVLTAFVVSLWGISSHFGKDPSCLVLIGKLTSTCWQKEFDPTLRIFSTLGQPNWLASYLVITLPLTLAFAINFSQKQPRMLFTVVTLILFAALIMTTSRAGFLGAAISLGLTLLLIGLKKIKQNLRLLAIIFLGFLLIAAIFGTNLFSRFGEALTRNQQSTTHLRQDFGGQANNQVPVKPTDGTESGTIRLIVWQGAFEVFKRWPILGSGPETFAYSYYLFRPIAHNQTTEWDFFYNKAHNEFLNYLANLGILGTVSYLAFIGLSIFSLLRFRQKSEQDSILAKSAIGSIIGYQTTIFFGFSVVTTQLLMFLIVAIFLLRTSRARIDSGVVESDSTPQNDNRKIRNYQKIAFVILGIIGLYTITLVGRIYLADLTFARVQASSTGDGQTLIDYSNAVDIFPAINPFYLANYAYESALFAASTDDPEITSSLVSQTQISSEKTLGASPNNLITTRKIANAYFLISDFNKKYSQKALETGQTLVKLAPTDPQSYLTLGKIQAGLGQEEDAKKTLETALNLKSDYQEAKELLEQLTIDK